MLMPFYFLFHLKGRRQDWNSQEELTGSLHFFINGTDQGEAVSSLPVVVYGAVDIYGAAVRVSIVSVEEECKIVKSNIMYPYNMNMEINQEFSAVFSRISKL